jgi:SAM-dependent methyltransferase
VTSATERDLLRERLRPYVERARHFSGWVFDYTSRRLGPDKPWSYSGRARELVRDADRVVDLGTGGGERFAELIERHTGLAIATEEWSVNVPVAADRLRQYGPAVLNCSSVSLPFADASLDLVLSRHEAIDPFEVARILAPGGVVLTQQTGNEDWSELRDFFRRWHDHGDHYAYYRAGFRAAGLEVVRGERHYETVAYHFEDVVYQLCIMPWWIADFDPLVSDLDALLALSARCNGDGELLLSQARYILEARKPQAGVG